jgi:transposase
MCSVRSALNSELAQPLCCRPATPKPCSFISTRSRPRSRPGAHAILILDQAGWHGAKGLKAPGNISLLPLPPRSPELNPQENIWQFMRANWLSNRVFKSFDDIVDHCCYAWNTLIDQPWKIMSIARRDWALAGHSL